MDKYAIMNNNGDLKRLPVKSLADAKKYVKRFKLLKFRPTGAILITRRGASAACAYVKFVKTDKETKFGTKKNFVLMF